VRGRGSIKRGRASERASERGVREPARRRSVRQPRRRRRRSSAARSRCAAAPAAAPPPPRRRLLRAASPARRPPGAPGLGSGGAGGGGRRPDRFAGPACGSNGPPETGRMAGPMRANWPGPMRPNGRLLSRPSHATAGGPRPAQRGPRLRLKRVPRLARPPSNLENPPHHSAPWRLSSRCTSPVLACAAARDRPNNRARGPIAAVHARTLPCALNNARTRAMLVEAPASRPASSRRILHALTPAFTMRRKRAYFDGGAGVGLHLDVPESPLNGAYRPGPRYIAPGPDRSLRRPAAA
jgi:hypothetical protein